MLWMLKVFEVMSLLHEWLQSPGPQSCTKENKLRKFIKAQIVKLNCCDLFRGIVNCLIKKKNTTMSANSYPFLSFPHPLLHLVYVFWGWGTCWWIHGQPFPSRGLGKYRHCNMHHRESKQSDQQTTRREDNRPTR